MIFQRMWSNAALMKNIDAGSAGYLMTDLLKNTIWCGWITEDSDPVTV